MSRQYSDHITVRCSAASTAAGDGPPPEQFVWRRRRYRVLDILQRWVEVGPWWRAAGSAADEEYELWRVEAAAGPPAWPQSGPQSGPPSGQPSGQYDLCRHRSTGHWFMVRTFD